MSYRGFKKVSQDAKTTTFQHPNGSELKVAHGHISPELKKRLDALPMHLADGTQDHPVSGSDDDDKFTFSGEDQPYTMASAGDQPYGLPPAATASALSMPTANSGITVNPNSSVTMGATDPSQVNTGDQQPTVPTAPAPAPQDDSDDSDDSGSPAQFAPSSAPVQPHQPVRGDIVNTPMTAQQIMQQQNQDYQEMKQMFQSGQIKPKTYNDLFEDKGTLGKVGTLFGLLISGAGSGLTHQPNAVLEMMNKQIDRDLEAQKASKGNQLNALSMATNHLRAMSEASMQGKQQEIMGAQKGLVGAQSQEAQARAKLLATDNAKASMLLGVQQDLLGKVSSIPPGPQKQAADQAMQVISSGIDQHVAQNNAQTAAQIEGGWQRRNTAMNLVMPEQAKYEAEHHIPNMKGQTSQVVTGADRDQLNSMNVLDAKGKDLLSFINQNKGVTGALGVQTKNTARQKLAELLSFYNQSVQGGQLTAGRLGWYDEQLGKDPTGAVNQLFGGDTARLKEVVSSNALRRDNMLTGKLGYTGPETENQSQPPQGSPQLTDKKGNQIVMIDGKPYRKKAQ